MTDQLLYTLDETGERLRICRSGVCKLINNGELKSIKIGRRRLIAHEDLIGFIQETREAA